MNNVSIGTWIMLGHPSLGEIMADAGFDWVCVDMEHSVIDYAEAQLLIAAIQSRGKQAYVRVGENNTRIIKRVLDAGADGIIVPMVNTAEDAKKAVEAVKYPPEGKRGVGLARAQGYGFNFDDYKNRQAKEVKVVVMIEHVDAVRNLREILAVRGVDGTFIGPYDLSGSVGKPGAFNEPEIQRALADYERVHKEFPDKWMGFHVVPPDHRLLQEKIDKGYKFLAFGFDGMFMSTKAREELQQITITTNNTTNDTKRMKVVGIIPARMAATRFPGKPLAKIHGMPMVGHCYMRTKMCDLFDEVYVATCDEEIRDYIESIGGKAVMTKDTHERATDRTAEAVQNIEAATGEPVDVVVMVQGDEPMLVPEMLADAIRPMLADPELQILNIISRIPSREVFESPNSVKVVTDLAGNMLYLSRAPIPSDVKYKGEIPMQKQLGIILFRRDFLLKYNNMPQTPLEKIESVDMLRVLENGIRIQTTLARVDTWSVDTAEELAYVAEKMQGDPLIVKYLT